MLIQLTLIESCINGERKAEYELFKVCYPYLMSICIRYTRNQDKAKEVLNLGFYKILSNLNKYDKVSPIKPWIRKIMINTLINEFKKEKLHYQTMQYVETYFEEETYAELNESIARSNVEEIYGYIAQLAPASRQVFNLYFIDGYKHIRFKNENFNEVEILKRTNDYFEWFNKRRSIRDFFGKGNPI